MSGLGGRTDMPFERANFFRETTMGESNSVIIRKAYEDFAHGNIPAVFAAFDAGHHMARSRS
jgi:hypothetical protein